MSSLAPGTVEDHGLNRYLETPVVQLNQVGYSPYAQHRWAYGSGWMGDGGPLDLSGFSGEVEVLRASSTGPPSSVAVLPLTTRSERDDDAGTGVRRPPTADECEGTLLIVLSFGVPLSPLSPSRRSRPSDSRELAERLRARWVQKKTL